MGTMQHSNLALRPLQLGAIPSSPGTARELTRTMLAGQGLGRLSETAELVASELVTNAVQASEQYAVPPSIEFRVSVVEGRYAHIEVRDCDSRPPILRNALADDESGRGLVLVQALSLEWGWYPLRQGGKCIWATVGND